MANLTFYRLRVCVNAFLLSCFNFIIIFHLYYISGLGSFAFIVVIGCSCWQHPQGAISHFKGTWEEVSPKLTHSPVHHFETVPNSERICRRQLKCGLRQKLQTTTEMWLSMDFKIQIA